METSSSKKGGFLGLRYSAKCPNCKEPIPNWPMGRDWWRTLRICDHCGMGVKANNLWLLSFVTLIVAGFIASYGIIVKDLTLGIAISGAVILLITYLQIKFRDTKSLPSEVVSKQNIRRLEKIISLYGTFMFLIFAISAVIQYLDYQSLHADPESLTDLGSLEKLRDKHQELTYYLYFIWGLLAVSLIPFSIIDIKWLRAIKKAKQEAGGVVEVTLKSNQPVANGQ